MILNGSPDDRHAQSGAAFAHLLLCVERFEYLPDVRIRYAFAGIGNVQDDIFSLGYILITVEGPIKIPVLRGDGDFTATADRLCGVGDQVHDRLR